MDSEQRVLNYMDENRQELFECLSDLLKINTENFITHGNEEECADAVKKLYEGIGLETEQYYPDDYLKGHPAYLPGRGTDKRPNVGGVYRGTEGNKSVMVAAHMDTVEIGDPKDWSVDPLGGEIRDGRIYGRGSCDNKFGLATGVFALKAIMECGLRLRENVILSAYCDEEDGGGNGTIASCVKYPCDVYVNLDAGNSERELWIASVGGQALAAEIRAKEPQDSAALVVSGMNLLNEELEKFGQARREELGKNGFFAGSDIQRSAMRITCFSCGGGFDMAHGRVQFSFYTDRTKEEVWNELHHIERRMREKLDGLGLVFDGFQEVSRYFDYKYADAEDPAVCLMAECASETSGNPIKKTGACLSDLFLYMEYGSPASFGYGIMRDFKLYGGAHQPDEYVDCVDFLNCTKAVALFLMRWCGIEK